MFHDNQKQNINIWKMFTPVIMSVGTDLKNISDKSEHF